VGRPRSGSENRLRNHVQTTRLDDAEKAAIQQAADAAGLNVSELVRRAVLRDIGYPAAV
jgi:uncharacterized protein (DUF1778 family)